MDFRVGLAVFASIGMTVLGAAPARATQVSVYPLSVLGYMPDSVVKSANGAIWFSAAQLKPCHGNVTCQTEELGTLRGHALIEQNLGPQTLAGETYGATPGPGPSIWFTDPLKAARVFDLSGKQIATVRFGGQNGSGALSAPFIGPDGRMWLTLGSFGLGGGGVAAVDANYKTALVARCKQCFFSGGAVAADSDAWLLDPYLGGFYRVTPSGNLTRFDFGKFTLQTMIAGPNGNLWGLENFDIAQYDLHGVHAQDQRAERSADVRRQAGLGEFRPVRAGRQRARRRYDDTIRQRHRATLWRRRLLPGEVAAMVFERTGPRRGRRTLRGHRLCSAAGSLHHRRPRLPRANLVVDLR